MIREKRSMYWAAAVLVAVSALSVTAAYGAESMDDYKAAVEPICRKNTQANERILSGVRTEVKKGELPAAAAQFSRAAHALAVAWRELAAVDKPISEASRLTQWLSYVHTEVVILKNIARELRQGNRAQAERLVGKLYRVSAEANNKIVVYGFRYCRFHSSAFS